MNKICAIVVVYHPQAERLSALFKRLCKQVGHLVIIDNSSSKKQIYEAINDSQSNENIFSVIDSGGNVGIATGFNRGIKIARELNFEYVLLSDQDSLPDINMVDYLFKSLSELSLQGKKVGAVGPTYFDETTRVVHPFQIKKKYRLFYTHAVPNKDSIECLTLISSGSLIPISVIDVVGMMRDDMFIDNVDVEWCFRAISKGYHLYGVKDAKMGHRRGEGGLNVWFFKWKVLNLYPPERMYYQFRNFIVVNKLRYVPLMWKVRSLFYWAGMLYGYIFFVKNRTTYCKYITKGIWDGVVGNLGSFQEINKSHCKT